MLSREKQSSRTPLAWIGLDWQGMWVRWPDRLRRGWLRRPRQGKTERVLIPMGGGSEVHEARARLLATLCREKPRELVFLTVLPTSASDSEMASAERAMRRMADMRIPVVPQVAVVRHDDPPSAILAESERCDLLVLGMRRRSKRAKGARAVQPAHPVRRAVCGDVAVAAHRRHERALPAAPRKVVQDAVAVMPWATRRADTQDE
jgi:nucleotide-binding universal stress UspA family protein